MLIVVKVQGGKENEEEALRMLRGLENPIHGEPMQIVILPWFAEFTELPLELIEKLVASMTAYLAETE